MKKVSLKNIKAVNAGDIFELTKTDVSFFQSLMAKKNKQKRSMEMIMEMIMELYHQEIDRAWESFLKSTLFLKDLNYPLIARNALFLF